MGHSDGPAMQFFGSESEIGQTVRPPVRYRHRGVIESRIERRPEPAGWPACGLAAAMDLRATKPPRCPQCREAMLFVLIEPERPGYTRRVYACPECHRTETVVGPQVSMEVSIDVSIDSAAP